MANWEELKNNPRLRKIHDERLRILRAIREFFWSEEFVEMETPVALRYAGQEPYLNPVRINIEHPDKSHYEFFLRTSPEYSLKKLLAAGYGKIFEVGKCFRNNEDFGGTHNTEFTMLEWYRAPGELTHIMTDTEKLFKYVLKTLCKKSVFYKGKEIDISGTWDRVSVKELFQKHLGVNLDEYLEIENLSKLVQEKGYNVTADDEYEDLFFKLFLNKIEGNLGTGRPVFVYDYPARMCSLSRLTNDPRYAERFELYIGGLELANAFGELTDPGEQKTRLENDKSLREKLGKPVWPVDPAFISALESGIPEKTAGIALGVDRMIVLITQARDINEVIFNNIKDQISS